MPRWKSIVKKSMVKIAQNEFFLFNLNKTQIILLAQKKSLQLVNAFIFTPSDKYLFNKKIIYPINGIIP